MKFSINTQFYNRGHRVEKIYEQILDQTYKNWEWIVTDDFSEFDSAEDKLIEISIKDPRVKYFRQSRKKECLYNPQRGCSGDICVTFDSDDYAYPALLETYAHFFEKHPEIIGISCYTRELHVDNKISSPYPYLYNDCKCETSSTFDLRPDFRAFRNIYGEFDNGKLHSYYADINILRHMEMIGKWLLLPLVLGDYLMSSDSWTKRNISPEEYTRNEEERIFLENQFPRLKDPNKCSHFPLYFDVMNIMRCFYLCKCNISKNRQNILFISSELTPYKRMLLKELFWFHNLFFDYNTNLTYDDIVINISHDILSEFPNLITKIKSKYSNFSINLYFLHKNLDTQEAEKIIYSLSLFFTFSHMSGESFYTIYI
jgi:glycosyltransferase involved in cell wall biosynthesis